VTSPKKNGKPICEGSEYDDENDGTEKSRGDDNDDDDDHPTFQLHKCTEQHDYVTCANYTHHPAPI
jgi:hypothetical protein